MNPKAARKRAPAITKKLLTEYKTMKESGSVDMDQPNEVFKVATKLGFSSMANFIRKRGLKSYKIIEEILKIREVKK